MAQELTQHILWHGEATAPSSVQWLTAGPVAAGFEDGQLRGIYAGGREVVRRIYGAVRDRFWNTVPGVLSELTVVEEAGGFRVSFVSTHVSAEVDFVWRGEITGGADGALRFAFTGEARKAMAKNRVGLCLLLPVWLAGQGAEVDYVSGDTAAVRFPESVDPMQPVRGLHDFRALRYELPAGVGVALAFSGDVFEIEDQRNWTDASYKAYSTPQRIPMPAQMKAGQRVEQAVTLHFTGNAAALPPAQVPEDAETVPVTLGAECGSLPRLGVGQAYHGAGLTAREVARLAALQLAHYRIELDTTVAGWEAEAQRRLTEAAAMGARAEVAVFISENAAEAAQALTALAPLHAGRVGQWLILTKGKPATQAATLRLAREALAGTGAPIGAGTDADFFQLNNNRPDAALCDFVSVPLRPCAHQFDRATLAENLDGQREVLTSLGRLYTLPRHVSPVSFRTRAQKGPAAAPGELPAQADVRQMSLLGAAWTVGSIKAVAESGAAQLTLFQTTGLRGIMEEEGGSAAPQEFHSVPGGVFPVYQVLKALAGCAGAAVLSATAAVPHRVEVLVLRRAGGFRALAANLTPTTRRVVLQQDGRAAFASAQVALLDSSSALEAMTQPESWPETTAECRDGTVLLPPFAVAVIDWQQP